MAHHRHGFIPALALTLLLGAAGTAGAASIVVTTLDDELNADGDCALREAITAANTNAATDACPGGDPGADTITVAVTGTITLASTLPAVTEALVIRGPGARDLTISGAGAVRVLRVASGGALELEDLAVADGRASVLGDDSGGGILAAGPLTITRCLLTRNHAGNNGGAIAADGVALTITESTLSGNTAAFHAGAVLVDNGGHATVTNSTFAGNEAVAADGGALLLANVSSATLTNTTLAGNSASSGGAVAGGDLTLRSSILANNTVQAFGPNCFAVSVVDGGGNLQFPDTEFPDTDCGATIPSADPLLDPAGLQANGGPTDTIALEPGSPALDAAVAAHCPATDQRGVARPQGPACDSGAYEREVPPAVLPVHHFLCYDVHDGPFPAIPGLAVTDQFGASTVTVRRPKRLCNPADKNGEDPGAEQARDHLVGYQIRQTPRFRPRYGDLVVNQFHADTPLRVDLVKPELLLVPSAKDVDAPVGPLAPPTIDHYKCYRVRNARTRVANVEVRDQFGLLVVDVKRPRWLCAPADKQGEGIADETTHLACYQVRRAASSPRLQAPRSVFIYNQFGGDILDRFRVTEICLPSLKNPYPGP
jgi:CSLREA domain-containing protein